MSLSLEASFVQASPVILYLFHLLLFDRQHMPLEKEPNLQELSQWFLSSRLQINQRAFAVISHMSQRQQYLVLNLWAQVWEVWLPCVIFQTVCAQVVGCS